MRTFLLFFCFLGKSTSKKTIPLKKIGVRRCLGELDGQKVQKPSEEFCLLFFRFLGLGVRSFWVRICFVLFVGEFDRSGRVQE